MEKKPSDVDKDKRTGWLRELVVGSKVLVENQYGALRLSTVKSITATGKITIDSGSIFSVGGSYKASMFGYVYLRESSEENMLRYTTARARATLQDRLYKLKVDELPLEQIKAILAVLPEKPS